MKFVPLHIMKKLLLLFCITLFIGGIPHSLKAQCYGTVELDTYVNANGSNTVNITTAYNDELIMISYDGWPSPGNGPVKVDGNNATHVITGFDNINSGIAEVYSYLAPTAGTHTITCTEPNYGSPYYLNLAAAFYETGALSPLSAGTSTDATITCTTGGSISTSIATTTPGSMIYCDFENNNGQTGPFTDSWTGATKLNQLHEGNGIDASQAYETACTAGTYTIGCSNNANPNNGCGGLVIDLVVISSQLVSGPCGGGLSVYTFQQNPTCGGGCDGSIGLAASGGTSPYMYTWSPNVSNNDTATGLCSGTYSVTVEDASCPPLDSTIVFTLPANSLIITPTVTASEKCNGDCIGSASVSITGGISPYTYSWAPVGGSTNSAVGLCAGVYTITVSDINGCTGTALTTITQPAPVKGTPVVNNIVCNGGVGSATITGTGGTSPYTYLWTPSGQTTANATGLSAGTYTVNITDIRGCTGTVLVTLTQPAPLIANISNPTYPVCNGGNGGSASGSASGGVSPYTYAWSPGSQTNANATGLVAGIYTLTVKDKNGCTATTSIAITQPAVVSGNITIISTPACNGGTGSASIAGTGGTPGYTYIWNPGGQTNATATGLTAGVYTITVKDVNGCTGTVAATITQPNTLTVNATFTHASCGLANGTATANAAGGTTPYTYLWNPGGQTNMTATNLLAGSYTVTVTDKDHCTASASVTVTQPSAVLATITATTNINCYGFNDGSATVSASGGTGPYGYTWTPAGGNAATAPNLSAGTYVVTVKDANGCTVTATATLTQPNALNVTVSGPQIRCLGNTGTFTANVTGGTGPFSYNWSGAGVIGSNTNATVSLRPPGNQTYTVQVTDAHGCTTNGYVSFSFPPPLAVTINTAPINCSGRSATLCALATGGTGGDIYLWEPVNLSSPCVTIPVSVNTIYTITVTDNCSVSATATTTIHVNPPPAVNFSSNTIQGCEPLCVQFRNLTASSGGKEEYIWAFGNGDTVLEENPIYCYTSNGLYSVTLTVISDSGCSSTLSKVGMINVYNRPVASFTYSPQVPTILDPTVQFTDKSNDLSGIIYRLWNFGDTGDSSASNLQNPAHTYKDTGSYCASLIVMDPHGCTDTTTNCLVIEPQYNLYIPSAFTPNGDGIDDEFKPVGQYIKSFDMYIFDRWGLQLYHTTDINQGWNGSVHGSGSTAQEDTYIYKITVTDAQDNQHSYIGNVTLLK